MNKKQYVSPEWMLTDLDTEDILTISQADSYNMDNGVDSGDVGIYYWS